MPQVIDLNHLEKYVCGDGALLDEILCIFEEQARKWIERFDPDADDESWRNAAHSLKGASRGIGAWRIGDICESAESLVGPAESKRARRSGAIGELRMLVAEAVGEAAKIRRAS
jgi:HPt (histidine-containing phosphotransfer) domain-containing protein